MTDGQKNKIYLKDYQPFSYLVDSVDLTFRLDPLATRVLSRIRFRPNPKGQPGPLVLHGRDLTPIRMTIDGKPVSVLTGNDTISIKAPRTEFLWEAEVEINPAANTALDGLYMSGGIFSTQCEAEGFRRITYYPDRPDVLSVFTVRIESDLPVLLSNGNPTVRGPGWAEWHDPWPKPSYLFALVAGDLVTHPDNFVTRSGREVALNIWVRDGDQDKCAYAMDALKRSMKWDEDVYGREYDLDVFNIVAIDDFNAGAMENKGLNIFNSKLVLARSDTATDTDYEAIESTIAHEYFHNWTGNRVTCRDWFQLCLKEGLTVFRDQQFSGDMRSRAIKRIDDVLVLRGAQFREDAGPLAHPVRPESFVEINNFYTATVYEKGAEVIGMLRTLVGGAAYERALSLYFDRFDGQATTIEKWLDVFQDVTGRDLTQFKRWYSQAGTPRLKVEEDYEDGCYRLTFHQRTAPTADEPHKAPQVIPIAVGLLNPNGDEVVPTRILEMTKDSQSFVFEGLSSRPTASILRNFSAPVILERSSDNKERAFLLAHDTDPFNKWDAGRALAKDILLRRISGETADAAILVDALARVLADDSLDPAFRALTLALPSEDDLAQNLFDIGRVADPIQIHIARCELRDHVARSLQTALMSTFDAMVVPGPYQPLAEDAGKRALRLAALSLLTEIDGGQRAHDLFGTADNLTEQFAALSALVPTRHGPDATDRFYAQWQSERLVIDKWFTIQTARADRDRALDVARGLAEHPDFTPANPNRWRALMNGLVNMNPAGFHRSDGAAYAWFADQLIALDARNPQVAARATTFFGTWKRYDSDRQQMMRHELSRILASKTLSSESREIVSRLLNG